MPRSKSWPASPPLRIQSPKPRRARGTGTVFRDKRTGLWIGRMPIGRNAKGQTVYVERRRETQAEVVEALRVAGPPGPQTTVSDWADRWLATLDVRESTKDDYIHTVERFVKPSLGHLPVAALTAHQIKAAARTWARKPGQPGGLGPNTVRKNLGHLSFMLEEARRAGLIEKNPAPDAGKPRAVRTTITIFSAEELLAIIRFASLHRDRRPFAVLAATGCRLGEVLGLNVEDFDPLARTLSIKRTYSRRHGERPPKSANSVRTIDVAAEAIPAIEAAVAGRTSGPLFPTPVGQRRQHSALQVGWRTTLRRMGIAYRNLHQLRHSAGSAMVAGGLPLPDLAKHLGDTLAMIVKTYVHATGVSPARVMDNVLGACWRAT
jgi:integrase